jgi:hypothetical protein
VQLERHFAIPKVHSDAVIITRSERMIRSKWHKHTRWLGQNRRIKEVEPDGHGEAVRDQELHLNELASIVSRLSLPNSPLLDQPRMAHRVRIKAALLSSP